MRRAIRCTALALLIATAAHAGQERLTPSDADRILSRAYQILGSYSAMSGQEFRIRIEGIRTVKPADFGNVLWLDLITMPGGDMVDMTRQLRAYNDVAEAVTYRPKWNLAAADYLDTDEGQRLHGMTVQEVLAVFAEKDPGFAQVTAITSYDAEVELEGRTRSYKAAILWFRDGSDGAARISFLDNITQGVEEAVREKPIVPRPRVDLDLADKTEGKQCNPTSRTFTRSLYQTGTDGHQRNAAGQIDGWHISEAMVDFQCSCESDCSQSCTPKFNATICDDSGATFMCHKMAGSGGLEDGGAEDASSIASGGAGGQKCSASWGCVKKDCPFCICFTALGVSTSISNGNVSFSVSGNPDWAPAPLKFNYTCAACQLVIGNTGTPRPPRNQDTGTGDGGGPPGYSSPISGCCYWRTSCTYNQTGASGSLTCSPTTCGQTGC